ncbi:MAG: AMP-binding protein [Pseudomonadota bacterium]
MNIFTRLIRFFARALVRILYRVEVVDEHHYFEAGDRVLVVANHVSLLDGVLLYLFLPEPPTFAIDPGMANRWYFKPLLKLGDLFEMDRLSPIALKSMIKFLKDDNKAAIFPEGRISVTGSLMKIYEGPGMIADMADAMVLPVGIEGAQYSRVSYLKGAQILRWFPKIRLTYLKPRKLNVPSDLSGHERRRQSAQNLAAIMREVSYANAFREETVFDAVLRASKIHGANRLVLEDSTGAKLSYLKLFMRAYVVGRFIERDTTADDRIGIMLPSTVAAVVVMFATLARGRVAAMMNFTAGSKGLSIAAETANVKVVYTSRAFIETAGLEAEIDALSQKTRIVYLEEFRDQVTIFMKLGAVCARFFPRIFCCSNPGAVNTKESVILFTSGSEGVPKGVVLSHRNLLANRAQIQMLIDLNHRDVMLNILPIFHAFGLTGGILLPLLDGVKTYFYPSPLHYRIIPELCYEIGATCLFGTNTFLTGYAKYGHPYDFFQMRYVVAGAERLTDETRKLWSEKFGVRVFEGYGATEASPVIAVNTPMGNEPGTVGQIVTMMSHYLEKVEGISSGGRLIVRGPNVMQGYLFHGGDGKCYAPSTDRGEGWYDTGDIVEVSQEGFIKIVGRQKRFAKVGGEMVSLTQAEELANSAYPDNTHAAVALPDAKKGEQIILISEKIEVDRANLVKAAKTLETSELAIPKRVYSCEEIPLLGSGKVNYPALKDLAETLTGS